MYFENHPIKMSLLIEREYPYEIRAMFPSHGSAQLSFNETIFTCERDEIRGEIEADLAIGWLLKIFTECNGTLIADAIVEAIITKNTGGSVAKISKLHFCCTAKQLESQSALEVRLSKTTP